MSIKDEAFLEKADRGEYRLSQLDVLKVTLEQRQRVTVSGSVETSYEILAVLDYFKAPEQTILPPVDDAA